MSTLVFDLEAGRLLAVEVDVGRNNAVRLRHAVRADIEGDENDPQQVGRWLRAVLDENGISAKSAIFSVSRGEAFIKRLEPPAGVLSRAERHEMIHLQMSRQASLTSAENVIDYFAIDGDDGPIAAAAMPAERVRWRREVARAAGLKLEGIRLRNAGVRAMLGKADHDARSAMVIAPGLGSLELLVIESGRLVFSRSIDAALPMSTERRALEHYAERVAVEASRTWVSYRVSPDGREVERLVVLGAEPLAGTVARAASERLELPHEVFTPDAFFRADESIDPLVLTPAIPLAGLPLCDSLRIPVLDFANPTKPPDTRAGLRQAVLASVFVLIVLVGAGYLFARNRLDDERAALTVLREDHNKARDRYIRAQLAGARLGHMRAWADRSIDWFEHLDAVIAKMPGPTEAVLSKLAVEISHRAVFKEGARLNDPAAWSAESLLTISLAGRVRNRAEAERFRQRLLDSGIYTVTSQGPEVEDRFALQVVTGAPTASDPSGPDTGEETP